jgi:hypothetical protein
MDVPGTQSRAALAAGAKGAPLRRAVGAHNCRNVAGLSTGARFHRNRIAVRPVGLYMRVCLLLAACCAMPAFCQDAREIVRKTVELDQNNWARMADYTWVMRSRERHFDSHQRITSEHDEAWETLVFDGQPYRRLLERDGKPLPPDEARKQQEKLDKVAARVDSETPEEKQKHAAEYAHSRRREREFLRAIPDAYDLRIDGDAKIDGHDVWVISGTPKPGYHPKNRLEQAMLKVHGKIWIEKTGYQWVRLEAETTETISFGVFLARLNPGAKLVVEQTCIDGQVWLPKREYMVGSGRVALLKRLSEDDEVTWNDYQKFRVDSKVVSSSQP